jgi:multidrug resistance efflux pump
MNTIMKNKKTIIILVIVVIAAIAIFNMYQAKGNVQGDSETSEQENKIPVQVQTIVSQNEIVSQLSVEGTSIPKEYSSINSLAQGVVEYLAPVGSNVQIGEPLFRIRNESVESSYFLALQNKQQTSIATSQRVNQAELGLNSAAARLSLAQKNLETAKKQINQNLSTARISAIVSYNSAYSAINQAINSLGTTSFHAKSDYIYQHVLTVNIEYKNTTSDQFEKTILSFEALPATVNIDNISSALEKISQTLIEAKNLTDRTSIVLQAIITSDNFSAADLATAKSINNGHQLTINQTIGSVISAQNSLENSTSGFDLNIDQARNQLELAEIEHSNAEINLSNARISAQLENNLTQNQLAGAQYGYDNLNISSPFSGTILSHGVTPGEQITPGQKIIEVGNLNLIEIRVEIDSEFAKQLNLLDVVSIKGLYQGVISAIEPTGDLNSGNSGITIAIDNSDNKIDAGRLVDIMFDLKYNRDNIIAVPIKAVTVVANDTYVLLAKDGLATKQTVELGDTLGNQIIITSGLNIDDQVIVPNGVFVSDGENVEIINQ